MRNKNIMFVAVFIGALAALMFLQYQKKQKAEYNKKIAEETDRIKQKKTDEDSLVKIVSAQKDLPEGTKLTKSDLQEVEIPKKDVKPDYFKEEKEVIGLTTRTGIFKDEPIRKGRVDLKESAKKLADLIEKGNRAITIKVTNMSGIGGFLKQGDRVDVIATFDKRTLGDELTKTILQNLKVLAAGKKLYYTNPELIPEENAKKAPPPKPGAPQGPQANVRTENAAYVELVTVEVTPDQAEKLSLIVESAKLILVLRSPVDNDTVVTEGTNPFSLTGTIDFKKVKELEGKGHPIIFIEEDKTTTKYITY